jgi:tight adherence protein C
MADLLIPILTFLSVVTIGGAVLLIRGSRRRVLEARLYGAASTGVPSPSFGGFNSGDDRGGFVGAVEQLGKAVSSGKPAPSDLRARLLQAGYYDETTPTIYVGAQLALVLLGLPVGGFLAYSFDLSMMARAAIVFGLVALLGLIPNIVVMLKRSKRTAEVQRNLPDAIDLLEICVSSGMGLDMAWNSVTDEIRGVSRTLADEMALSSLEMHLGAQRADALRHMAQRTGVDDVSSLVATLVQSERFGTSISQALRAYADDMRTERSQRAEEQAEKLAVKLLFPMVMFIFPCMLVVILGPAVIKIAGVFASG